MLPKENRLSRKEVDQVWKAGRFINTSNLTFKYLRAGSEVKISIVAPKSIAKLATKRNYLRRLGCGLVQASFKKFPAPLLATLTFRKYVTDKTMLLNEIESILNKIN